MQRPTLWELFRYFVRLGATGFGGPIALVGYLVAGVPGAIAAAAVVLGRRAIVDVATAAIAVGSFLVLTTIRKLPEPLLVLAAGVFGISISELKS